MEQEQVERLERLRERGLEAEQCLRDLQANAYFKGVIEGIEKELAATLLGLPPEQKEAFVILQSKRIALYEPFGRIQADIAAGRDAAGKLDGTTPEGGIL